MLGQLPRSIGANIRARCEKRYTGHKINRW